MAKQASHVAAVLSDFADRIDRVWDEYDAHGPGQVDHAALASIEDRSAQLLCLLDGPPPADIDGEALGAAIVQATELARRCITLPQGLCFVSGEAGLVPRRDQIEAFAAACAALRKVVGQMAG